MIHEQIRKSHPTPRHQGVTLAVLGMAIGLAAALAMGKVMTTLLYGVSACDPLTFAGGSLALLTVAVLACLLPVRRASRISPSEAAEGRMTGSSDFNWDNAQDVEEQKAAWPSRS